MVRRKFIEACFYDGEESELDIEGRLQRHLDNLRSAKETGSDFQVSDSGKEPPWRAIALGRLEGRAPMRVSAAEPAN